VARTSAEGRGVNAAERIKLGEVEVEVENPDAELAASLDGNHELWVTDTVFGRRNDPRVDTDRVSAVESDDKTYRNPENSFSIEGDCDKRGDRLGYDFRKPARLMLLCRR